MKKMGAIVGVAAAIAVPAVAGAFTPHFRSCGSVQLMISNQVWATRNVGCAQARRLMYKLLDTSQACYPNGFTARPRCKLEGFACSAHPVGSHRQESRGNCVNQRRWVTGLAGP